MSKYESFYSVKLAENLKTLLDGNGISAKALAKELKIPDITLYRYVNRERVPKLDNIILLASHFQVSLDWLVGLTDTPRSNYTPEADEVASLYSSASMADREVVRTVLKKYKKEPVE